MTQQVCGSCKFYQRETTVPEWSACHKDDSVVSLHLELWRESSIGFFLDAAVAVGDLMVVGGFENDPQYQMTPSGKLHVEAKFRIQR